MIAAMWRQLVRGMAALRDRRATDAEIDDEVSHYLDEAIASHLARGVSARAARRAALLELRGEVQAREEVRAYGWENRIEEFFADVRHSVRGLVAAPGFAIAAILTLGIGTGGATAILSAVRPVLFDTLPYPEAERIRVIQELNANGSRADGTFGMYLALAERTRSFEALAVFRAWQPTRTGRGDAERVFGQRVSAGYFGVLGIAPVHGRGFSAADDVRDASDVVILSHEYWRQRFGADPSILGRPVTLDGRQHTVIGVMPPTFENVVLPHAHIWAPLQYEMDEGRAWGHHLRTIGRLRAGVVGGDATRELNAIAADVIATQRPPTYGGDVVWIAPSLRDEVARVVRPALLAMLGAVVLLLAMAYVSVANLLLARGVRRRAEFDLRLALGASRGRVVRQLLTESFVLAVAGGAAGFVVAHVGVHALVALAPDALPRVHAVTLDARALLAGVSIATVVGTVAGTLPLLAPRGTHGMRPGSRITTGPAQRRMRSGLVVAQVAIALVLLAGAGLLLRSVQRLMAVPPGFDGGHVVSLQVQISGARFVDDASIRRYHAAILEAAAGVPGVRTVGLTSQLPLSGDHDTWGVHFEASAAPHGADERGAFRYAVSAGYTDAMGIALRGGRALSQADREDAPLVALISESMARRRFPDGDALGQRLRIGPYDSEPYTVVGVVADVSHESLALGPTDAVYVTGGQWRFADRVVTLVVRAEGDVASLVAPLRDAIRNVDRDQPITRVARIDELIAASAAERSFALLIFQAFALAALLLAATGLYGVTAGSVEERTREFGIRSALGAAQPAIVVMVLVQGLRLALAGVVAGLVIAAVASRGLDALLYGVARLDPLTFAAVTALLVVTALIASGVPAWRAGRADTATALRAE